MKKIIISSVLAIISLMVGTFSFIINDLPATTAGWRTTGPG